MTEESNRFDVKTLGVLVATVLGTNGAQFGLSASAEKAHIEDIRRDKEECRADWRACHEDLMICLDGEPVFMELDDVE